MSEVFENDIADDEESILELEDEQIDDGKSFTGNYEYPSPLYKLLLDYSNESVYATVTDQMKIEDGDFVIIQTRYGKDMAKVAGLVKKPINLKPSDVITIERKANHDDLERSNNLREKEKDAFRIFKEKVNNHKLSMKLITTHYLLEEQKILFFFSSENRVDFRELVKDLVSIFKMRIELRQIGVRDESRITGGLGVCGRPYCCHSVSDRLRPVSIKMAKDQNLSLNSMKISGQCGRLLCCLSYESDCYSEARKKMPNVGVRLPYDGTNFRVTEINPLVGLIKILGEDGRLLEIGASRLAYQDGKWKIVD